MDPPLRQADLEWMSIEEQAIMFGEMKGYAAEKGYQPLWAVLKFRERFGHKPGANVLATPQLDCGPLTRLWIRASMDEGWRREKERRR